MKYAACMALAGELVSAEDANHETFKRLVPICPECGSPVFYRQAQNRTSKKEKPFIIGAHWCHFHTDLEKAVDCEARVAKYTPQQKNKIKTQARNQRLKWLQRGFWKTLQKYHLSDSNYIETQLIPYIESNVTVLYKLIEDIIDYQYIDIYQKNIDGAITNIKNKKIFSSFREWKTGNFIVPILDTQEQYVTVEQNLYLAEKYVKEVFSFIKSPKNKYILKLLVYYSVHDNFIYDFHSGARIPKCPIFTINSPDGYAYAIEFIDLNSITDDEYSKRIRSFITSIECTLFAILMTIPWDYEFNYLRQHGQFSTIIPENYSYSAT